MSGLRNSSGSLGAAMAAAGIDTAKARLFTTAVQALKHGEACAAEAFLAVLKADESLQAALAREYLATLVKRYLQDRSADIAGQSKSEARGRIPPDALDLGAFPASLTPCSDDNHLDLDARFADAVVGAPRSRSDGGRMRLVPQTTSAPVAPAPRPNRRAAIEAMHRVARPSLFDGYRIRTGEAIGDLPWCTLERLISTNAREAHVLRRVREFGRPADANDLVRNIVPERLIAEAIEEAKRLND